MYCYADSQAQFTNQQLRFQILENLIAHVSAVR
eukprot:SAG31_NODE_9935_length_1208_cov_1.211001_2_plen_32_part_01